MLKLHHRFCGTPTNATVVSNCKRAGCRRFNNGNINIGNSGTIANIFATGGSISASTSDSSASMYLGSASYASRPFTGQIDDVRIYNRVLTAQEAKDSYLSGAVLRGAVLKGLKENQ